MGSLNWSLGPAEQIGLWPRHPFRLTETENSAEFSRSDLARATLPWSVFFEICSIVHLGRRWQDNLDGFQPATAVKRFGPFEEGKAHDVEPAGRAATPSDLSLEQTLGRFGLNNGIRVAQTAYRGPNAHLCHPSGVAN